MLLTIILVLIFLVAINFLLLIFSCNKIIKPNVNDVRKPTLVESRLTNPQHNSHLAPTGS